MIRFGDVDVDFGHDTGREGHASLVVPHRLLDGRHVPFLFCTTQRTLDIRVLVYHTRNHTLFISLLQNGVEEKTEQRRDDEKKGEIGQ